MALVSLYIVIVVAMFVILSAWHQLPFQSRPWKGAFGVTVVVSLLVGLGLLTWRHQPSETVRLVGYPFPIGGAELIDGQWLTGSASPFGFFAIIANFATAILICFLPLRVLQWRALHRQAMKGRLEIQSIPTDGKADPRMECIDESRG